LLTACDVETLLPTRPAPPPVAPVPVAAPPPVIAPQAAVEAPAAAYRGEPPPPEGDEEEPAVPAVAPASLPDAVAPVTVPAAVASAAPAAPAAPLAAAAGDGTLRSRWPDVIEQVKSRNPILASLLGSAQPLGVDENLLTVAFSTDFNRKSAEKATHRQIIEAAFERIYGTAYRLRCTVKTDADSGPNLLDDPVINYATRTFGGQPRRVAPDQAGL
jgi:DNA polymerase-3 subunit gamma/tau